ncbi:MAG: RNA polymerase sigma factor [Sedimentisphaerales bacterium]|nr:RNA polymerase sigma factor [Sedimentisphaerales bacterium]
MNLGACVAGNFVIYFHADFSVISSILGFLERWGGRDRLIWMMINEREQRIYTELLVIRCQQGEKEAFESVVELWQRPMLAFALRYLGRDIDACDAVQETWVSVIKRLNALQNPSLFVSWLFRILTNKCIDRMRERQREARRLEETDVEPESSEAPSENDSLRQAVQRLSDEHKILIMLRFGQELQIGQIAAILNMAEGTVKSRLHRALARLREILGDTI